MDLEMIKIKVIVELIALNCNSDDNEDGRYAGCIYGGNCYRST